MKEWSNLSHCIITYSRLDFSAAVSHYSLCCILDCVFLRPCRCMVYHVVFWSKDGVRQQITLLSITSVLPLTGNACFTTWCSHLQCESQTQGLRLLVPSFWEVIASSAIDCRLETWTSWWSHHHRRLRQLPTMASGDPHAPWAGVAPARGRGQTMRRYPPPPVAAPPVDPPTSALQGSSTMDKKSRCRNRGQRSILVCESSARSRDSLWWRMCCHSVM